jgi:hypothetical protein
LARHQHQDIALSAGDKGDHRRPVELDHQVGDAVAVLVSDLDRRPLSRYGAACAGDAQHNGGDIDVSDVEWQR